MHKKWKLTIRKTYKDSKNLFKSRKTTYNKRLATKTVADWELQVVVSRAEPGFLGAQIISRHAWSRASEHNTMRRNDRTKYAETLHRLTNTFLHKTAFNWGKENWWPILCRVGRRTTTQSIARPVSVKLRTAQLLCGCSAGARAYSKEWAL